jgi:hypothetical protein
MVGNLLKEEDKLVVGQQLPILWRYGNENKISSMLGI